jgi:nitrogen regulatory protein PII
MNYHQVVCIVGKNQAEPLMALAKAAGSTGGTIFTARGTTSGGVLSFLCLDDCPKEILLTVVKDPDADNVFRTMEGHSGADGICLSSPCRRTYMKRNGEQTDGGDTMEGEWELIQVICKSGYADDIMVTARKAGAGGGTIVDGRGTSKPDDETFFGASLVPEKEMLMILVEARKAEAVFSAIVALPCMQEKGNGIVFSLPVERFAPLGKSAK